MREFKDLKIAVAGTGYVGLSIATLLSQHHQVTAVDIIPEKVELINNNHRSYGHAGQCRLGIYCKLQKPTFCSSPKWRYILLQ